MFLCLLSYFWDLWVLFPICLYWCLSLLNASSNVWSSWTVIRVWECIANGWLHAPVHGSSVSVWASLRGRRVDLPIGEIPKWQELEAVQLLRWILQPPSWARAGWYVSAHRCSGGCTEVEAELGVPYSAACTLYFTSLFSSFLFIPAFSYTGIAEYGPFLLNFLYFFVYECEWW